MSVVNGQPANQTTFNNAFLSKVTGLTWASDIVGVAAEKVHTEVLQVLIGACGDVNKANEVSVLNYVVYDNMLTK